jgi:hypothetical protein
VELAPGAVLILRAAREADELMRRGSSCVIEPGRAWGMGGRGIIMAAGILPAGRGVGNTDTVTATIQ